jgi:hypothetical protein
MFVIGERSLVVVVMMDDGHGRWLIPYDGPVVTELGTRILTHLEVNVITKEFKRRKDLTMKSICQHERQ